MVKIVVPLSRASREALDRLAARELRDPRLQAKLMLERALLEQGALPLEGADHRPAGSEGAGRVTRQVTRPHELIPATGSPGVRVNPATESAVLSGQNGNETACHRGESAGQLSGDDADTPLTPQGLDVASR